MMTERTAADELRKHIVFDEAFSQFVRDSHDRLAMRCAMWGHDFRDDVPGIDGTVCVCCGERPGSSSEMANR